MEPDAPYHPADHSAGLGKTACAWLLYALLLFAGLGLPSLWAAAVEPPTPPLTAKLPASGAAQVCEDQVRPPKLSVERDHMG